MIKKHKYSLLENMSQTRVIVLGFAVMIIIGTMFLRLPISTQSRQRASLLTALFTATSATCVTGLVIEDTYTYWSAFGRFVILFLIQFGGLGFMTMASIFSFTLKRRISFKQRILTAESFNQDSIEGIVQLTRYVIFGTLIIEGIGALILFICFRTRYSTGIALEKGIFHSISAFCNAGFDILGNKGKFSSAVSLNSNPIALYTLMALIIIGGLGFSVWKDVFNHKRRKKPFSLHTKIVFSTTFFLIISGFVLFFVFEYFNPKTIGSMSLFDKINNALFQSVTTRTAGFSSFDQNGMLEHSKFLTIILMFIGGSPGSTAGGIKTVTFAVLIMSSIGVMRGSYDINAFGRRLSRDLLSRCLAVVMLGIVIVTSGTMILAVIEKYDFMTVFFEVVSAFGTVGLSTGITPNLSSISKIILIVIMFFGRVGVLTFTWALVLKSKETLPKIRFPKERVSVG